MISQADEIELIYKGEYVTFDCPDRRIVVGAVEKQFGLKNVLFDKKCYPTDATGLTYKRFGEDVKSLTVTGEPAGAHCAIRDIILLFITCVHFYACCLLHVLMISYPARPIENEGHACPMDLDESAHCISMHPMHLPCGHVSSHMRALCRLPHCSESGKSACSRHLSHPYAP